MADKGHTVVGCDCAPLAFKEFFAENNVEFTTKKVDDFEVYTVCIWVLFFIEYIIISCSLAYVSKD